MKNSPESGTGTIYTRFGSGTKILYRSPALVSRNSIGVSRAAHLRCASRLSVEILDWKYLIL